MAKRIPDVPLKGKSLLDDLFKDNEPAEQELGEKVVDVPVEQIYDLPGHTFKTRKGADYERLRDRIAEVGVHTPTLLRPRKGGGYEAIAGHRRRDISKELGIPTIPAIIRNYTDDEAIIIMGSSNLDSRDEIFPSEKAFTYKAMLDAMKRQAGRKKNNYSPVANNLKAATSSGELSEQVGESKDQIFRYVRLTNLIPELLQMVDNTVTGEKPQIALRPAVELSYLTNEEQKKLLVTMEELESTPSHAQAIKMKVFSKEGRLTEDVIYSIMQEEKPNQVEQFKLPRARIDKFFRPGTSPEKIESDIVKGLELLRSREKQRNDVR